MGKLSQLMTEFAHNMIMAWYYRFMFYFSQDQYSRFRDPEIVGNFGNNKSISLPSAEFDYSMVSGYHVYIQMLGG